MFTMTDHYGWDTQDGRRIRPLGHDPETATLLTIDPTQPPTMPEANALNVTEWTAPAEYSIPANLWEPLAVLLPLHRVATPTLWEATATAVIRQVIRAAHAKELFGRLRDAAGAEYETGGHRYRLFPTPEAVLALADDDFADMGMAFKREPLRTIAEAYLKSGAEWEELSPQAAHDALLRLPRIGPWTTRVAVADWSNDFDFYPYDDLAVQTWARQAAPGLEWPDRAGFGPTWTARTRPHRTLLTVLALARGNHHAIAL